MKWISTWDHFPEKSSVVAVFRSISGGLISGAIYDPVEKFPDISPWIILSEFPHVRGDEVTHWLPLTQPTMTKYFMEGEIVWIISRNKIIKNVIDEINIVDSHARYSFRNIFGLFSKHDLFKTKEEALGVLYRRTHKIDIDCVPKEWELPDEMV